MSRTQDALKLAYADYPVCSKLNKRMSENEAAKIIGVRQGAVSRQAVEQRKKHPENCPHCGQKLNLGESK